MAEAPEPVCEASGLLDEQVDRFGAAVGDLVSGEVGQYLAAPGPEGPAESGDLGDRAGRERSDDLFGQPTAVVPGRCVVVRAESLVAVPGGGDFPARVPGDQADVEPVSLAVGEVLDASQINTQEPAAPGGLTLPKPRGV